MRQYLLENRWESDFTAKTLRSPSPRTRQEAPGADPPIVHRQNTGGNAGTVPAFCSGWRLPDDLMPQRGAGIDGSLNEARWFYAPTGRKGIAQGKAKRRPGIRCARNNPSPERAEPAVRQSMRTCSALSGLWRIGASAYPGRSRTTQGGAALYPGLSHYAPLGQTIRLRIGVDCK